MDGKFEGWSNVETFIVAHWIGNTPLVAQHWANEIAEIRSDPELGPTGVVSALEEGLIEEYNEGAKFFTMTLNELYIDLLQSALDSVNWCEIAEHLIAD